MVFTTPGGDICEIEVRLAFRAPPPVADRPWRPAGVGLRQDGLEKLSYIVVDEIVGEDVDLSVSSWPMVDVRGRLLMPTKDPLAVHAEVEALAAYVNRPDVRAGRRPIDIRMGTALAAEVRTRAMGVARAATRQVARAARPRHHRTGARQGEGSLLRRSRARARPQGGQGDPGGRERMSPQTAEQARGHPRGHLSGRRLPRKRRADRPRLLRAQRRRRRPAAHPASAARQRTRAAGRSSSTSAGPASCRHSSTACRNGSSSTSPTTASSSRSSSERIPTTITSPACPSSSSSGDTLSASTGSPATGTPRSPTRTPCTCSRTPTRTSSTPSRRAAPRASSDA